MMNIINIIIDQGKLSLIDWRYKLREDGLSVIMPLTPLDIAWSKDD